MLTPFKRFAAAAAVSLALATPAFAEAVSVPAPTMAPAIKDADPAIWTIAKPAGGTITLFGSVHLLPPGLVWRTKAFDEALARADVVVFEIPLAEMNELALQQYLAQNMMNPPGVTLSTLLTADEKARVEAAAKSVGASFAALEPFRPWMAALQISVAAVLKLGYDPNSGVDKLVEADAAKAGKALDYFETAREQLDMFITLPPEQEKAFLVSGATDMAKDPDMLNELVAAWAAGDAATIDRLMNEGLETDPALGKKLLEDRNARWVEKITSVYMNDTKNYLIVVGAGHLAGDKGVPHMLRAEGIEVAGP